MHNENDRPVKKTKLFRTPSGKVCVCLCVHLCLRESERRDEYVCVCFAVDTLHLVLFFFKCEMIPNFGHSLTFTVGFLALCNCANSILNVVVCGGNNSLRGKMIPELSWPHNAGDSN